MTWTVLIADDERIQREGIVKHVPWQQMGLALSGTAGDGEEALELMRAAPPDILVTDIKMPLMGGLELAKHAKSLNKHIKIIIISGYDDFEYARAAIELSATAYLLKPLYFPDLLHTLQNVAAACEEEAAREESRRDLDRQREENKQLAARQLLRNMLLGRVAGPEMPEAMRNVGMPEEQPYVIGVLRMNDERSGPGRRAGAGAKLEQKLGQFGSRLRWSEAYWSDGDELVWIASTEENAFLHLLDELRVYAKREIGGNLAACIVGGLYEPAAWAESYRRVSAELSRQSRPGFDKTLVLEEASGVNREASVQQLQAYMEARYASPITVKELARLVFLSPNYISNLFKELTGETIIDYLTGVRLRHARAQLADPLRKVYEIAHDTGFNSTSYFSVVFKNVYGISPKEYREGLRGQTPE